MSNEKDEPLSSEGEASGWSDEIFERAQERVENPEEESDFPSSQESERTQNGEIGQIDQEETQLKTTAVQVEEDFDFELPGPLRSNLRKIFEWVAVIGTAFIVAFIIKAFLLHPISINGTNFGYRRPGNCK